ncbi:MAG: PilZ domain-containing protein [Rhizobiaceae bacterium]
MGFAGKSDDSGASRRGSPRASCNMPATITFNGVELCEAIIKDISTTGIRLFIPNKAWLPHEFEVITPEISRPLKMRTCWSKNEQIGTEFVVKRGG